jgi:fructose-1,6-bisphosphatase/inositol monophosphatase family enzyme
VPVIAEVCREAGVTTMAVIFLPQDQSLYTAVLSKGAFLHQDRLHLSLSRPSPSNEVVLSVSGDHDALRGSLVEVGYRPRTGECDLRSLLAVAHGRVAGFIGDRIDPAVRLAAAMVISEARGQIGAWSGGYPEPGADTSLVAASHPTHFRRLTRAVGGRT